MQRRNIILILFLSILIFQNCKTLQATKTIPQNYSMTTEESLSEDSSMVALLAPYKVEMEAKMGVVLGHADQELLKQKPESTLGNWVADVTHKKCEAYLGEPIDFAVGNYGGMRIFRLAPGPITRGKIFELMPFDNNLVVMTIKGSLVQLLLARIAEAGGWPISYSVRMKIEEGKPQDILINGKALEENRIYKVGLTDFVANGGDQCFFLEEAPRINLKKKLRDAMMEVVAEEEAKGKGINAQLEGRIY